MKGVFVILDGVADEEIQSLGMKTPLEAAETPNLDELARKSEIGYCYIVKENFVAESHEAILSLLGYNYMDVQRGALEALGLGIKLKPGDLAFRCNFATIDDLENRNVLDRRAGRNLTTEESRILAKAINECVKLPYKFEFYPGMQHRGVLVIRGGFSNNISDVEEMKGKLEFSRALDDKDDGALAAEVVNRFIRQSFEVLDKHEVNKERSRKGFYPANVLLCRGASNEPAKLKKIRSKWAASVYAPLEIGIARAAGMDVRSFSYPKLKGIDIYANLYFGLNKAIKNARRMLRWKRRKYDYFLIHFKETDIPGHDGKPADKVKMIEILDKKFFSYLKKIIGNERLVVVADHVTSSRRKGHTQGAVPVLIYPSRGGKREQRFSENFALKGKKFMGKQLLEKSIFK